MNRRKVAHGSMARNGRHATAILREALGDGDFTFRPIIICAPSDVAMYEQLAIDALKPDLNSSPTASHSTMSPDGRERVRQSKLGRPRPDMIGNQQAAGKSPSPEVRARLSETSKAAWTPERRAAQSARATARHAANREKKK